MQKRYDAGEVITAMITPFDKDLKVDFNKVEKLAKHLSDNGSDAVLVVGTTGESPTLTHEEELDILRAVNNALRGTSTKIIMNTGSNSTLTAVEMSKKVEKTGMADALLSVVPYYNKPSQEGLINHFSMIADSTSLPIILYNIPGKGNVTVSYNGKEVFKGELPVTQFGYTETLVDGLFDKKINTRVIFNPNTGGVVKIDKD